MKPLSPEKATAVVTGGSRGIGKACALELAKDGWQVILTYVSRPEAAEQTVAEIEALGGCAKACQLDVADSASVAAFFKDEVKGKVNLGCLVNNAGVTRDGFLVRMKDEDFDAVVGTNLRGCFLCTREAAKIMTKNRAGSIVNVASVVGQMGNAGQANYAASKAGQVGLMKSLSKEVAKRRITVNCVSPGFIDTDFIAGLPEDQLAAYKKMVPAGRFGKPEEVAEAVLFLAGEKAAYINGAVLEITGGL